MPKPRSKPARAPRIEGTFLFSPPVADAAGNPVHSPLGSGWRLVIAYDRGPRRISLLGYGSLARMRCPVEIFDASSEAVDITPRELARGLEVRRRAMRRHGLRCAAKTARRVAAALRSAA